MAASGGLHVHGSVEDFEKLCKPCEDDGNFVEASGFCKNCNEYLCITCMNVHCLPKPSKHHVVLNKQQMPQLKPKKTEVASCTITCDKHPAECLKFVCTTHEVTGCGDCMVLDHKTCTVEYIPTLANGYNKRTEYTSVIQNVKKLRAEVNHKLTAGELSATRTEATVEKAISDLQDYKIDVIAYFDKVERILAETCNKIKLVNRNEVMKTSDELNCTSRRLASIEASLSSNIDNVANLYVLTRESRALLEALENELKAIKTTQPQYVKFVRNATLTSEMSAATTLGELQVNSKLPDCAGLERKRVVDMVPQHQADISMDTIPRCIRGIVKVRENTIACTDFNNKMVMLVDTNKRRMLSTVSVMDQPWDIASISPGSFAVTIPGSCKVQFIEVNNDIVSLKNVIGVNGECRGIDCFDTQLAVSYDKPPKVEILDFRGNVLSIIQTNKTGTILLKSPLYVAFSRDGESIYVSDRDDQSVNKLALDGTLQASYKDPELQSPRGLYVCSDGSVLVGSSHSIHVISGDCVKQKLLITSKEGVLFPSGISFDEDNGMLCVRKGGQVSTGKWLAVTVWGSILTAFKRSSSIDARALLDSGKHQP